MNRKNAILMLVGWLVLATLPIRGADSSTTLTGQVSNAVTRSFLEGAIVQIAGTNRVTFTDREGRYHFSGLQGEQVTLEVSFSGLDSKRVIVSVPAGQRVVHDVELTSEIYQLDKFTVAGIREGTAKAETLQRNAPNVMNVVSSDTFGNVADG